MKVTTAILSFATHTGSRTTAELNSVIDGDIRVDLERRLLRFGARLERHIPLESVRTFTTSSNWLLCPECAHEFEDARGLGAHRAHKHGVKGGK